MSFSEWCKNAKNFAPLLVLGGLKSGKRTSFLSVSRNQLKIIPRRPHRVSRQVEFYRHC